MKVHRVFIVLTPDFGESLACLPERRPVWIVDSPANSAVARRLWSERIGFRHRGGITVFTPGSDSPELNLLNVLDTIEEHHGSRSVNPPCSGLDVVGCNPSEAIAAKLLELGFVITFSGLNGFRADRVPE
jgi:hypothetical protein